MLHSIQGFKALVESGIISIESVEKSINNFSQILQSSDCFGQIVNAKAIASEKHCLAALEQTITAFESNFGIAKSKSIELLLRLSGKKQVSEALQLMQLKQGKQETVLVIAGKKEKKVKECFEKAVKEFNFESNLAILKQNPKKNFEFLQKAFCVSEGELESLAVFERKKALEKAIVEKIALLELEAKKQ